AFVLGFDRAELRGLWRRFLSGLALARHLARAGFGAVQGLVAGARQRRARPADDEAPFHREPTMARRPAETPDYLELESEMPEPELIERDADYDGDAPTEAELRGRISDAISKRTGKPSVLAAVAARLARDSSAAPRVEPAAPAPAPEARPFGAETPRQVVATPRKLDPS
ncbi:MAG: DNA translocase FtsK, partial [Pararhodobacter sp.]